MGGLLSMLWNRLFEINPKSACRDALQSSVQLTRLLSLSLRRCVSRMIGTSIKSVFGQAWLV